MSIKLQKVEEVDTSDDEMSTPKINKKKIITSVGKKRKISQVEDINAGYDHENKKVKTEDGLEKFYQTIKNIVKDNTVDEVIRYLSNFQKSYLRRSFSPVWFGEPLLASKSYINDGVLGFLSYHHESFKKNKLLVTTGFPIELANKLVNFIDASKFYSLSRGININMEMVIEKSNYIKNMVKQININIDNKGMIFKKDDWDKLKKICEKYYNHKETQEYNIHKLNNGRAFISIKLFSTFGELWNNIENHWKNLHINTNSITTTDNSNTSIFKSINLF